MTHDDIIRMAHEADCLDDQHYGTVWANKLERFAQLVAAHEREACAQVCEDMETHRFENYIGRDFAFYIRAKGNV